MEEPGTYFTDDIWLKIFPNLPWKAIFNFKRVSKLWNSELSSPRFQPPLMVIYIFTQRYLRKFSIAHLGNTPPQLIWKLSFEFITNSSCSEATLYLLGSSNGLVLCERNATHFVCNPLTEKWVRLPSTPHQLDFDTPHQLDFDRLETLTGFECDSLSTRFTVVRIPKWQWVVKKFNIQVFSSNLGRWDSYEVFCPDGVDLRFPGFGTFQTPPRGWDILPTDAVVIHKSVLYWMGWYDEILVYNLETFQECRLIQLPERGICIARCLGVSNRSMFYARIQRFEDNQEILCVWEVVQEGNFQLLHNNINLHDFFTEMNSKLSANFPGIQIKLIGFDPVDTDVVILGCRNYFWAYNIRTRRYEELSHPSSPGNEHSAYDFVHLPILLKLMPTAIPPMLVRYL